MSLVHYEGKLGVFDYDDNMFVMEGGNLRLRPKYRGPIDLPKGITDCSKMFYGRQLGGCYFRNFDTSEVTNMSYMFGSTMIHKNFTLGNYFDTSNVVNMRNMFESCVIHDGFTLGDKFDTSNVEDMSGMFMSCYMPEDFTFGSKFNTSKVSTFEYMFMDTKFSVDFVLPKNFVIHPNAIYTGMFLGCKDAFCGKIKDIRDILGC